MQKAIHAEKMRISPRSTRQEQKADEVDAKKAIRPMTLPCFDEMTNRAGAPRALYRRIAEWLEKSPPGLLDSRRQQAEMLFRRIGITFAVYGDKDAAERLIPFDIIPRLLGRDEWRRLEAGLIQRVKALNLFLTDVYGAQEILRAGIVPAGPGVPKSLLPARKCRDVPCPTTSGRAYFRHRHRAGGRPRLLCARRQCAHPLRRLLHAGKPRDDDPARARSLRRTFRPAGGELSRRPARLAAFGGAAPPARASPISSCSRRASIIPPITNIPSWPTSWASNWSRAAT